MSGLSTRSGTRAPAWLCTRWTSPLLPRPTGTTWQCSPPSSPIEWTRGDDTKDTRSVTTVASGGWGCAGLINTESDAVKCTHKQSAHNYRGRGINLQTLIIHTAQSWEVNTVFPPTKQTADTIFTQREANRAEYGQRLDICHTSCWGAFVVSGLLVMYVWLFGIMHFVRRTC